MQTVIWQTVIWRHVVLGLAVAAPLITASPATAQSPCGAEIRIAPGDTLGRLARQCGVSEEVLRRANPDIDWSLLRIGAPVTIPSLLPRGGERGPDRRGEPGRDAAGVYVIQRGDRIDDVADALGVSVDELLAANPGLSQRDLVPGREIRLGGSRRGRDDRRGPPSRLDVAMAEDSVDPGDVATIDIEGLPPKARVLVRAGPEGGRLRLESRGRADRSGAASIDIPVPDRARPGERWVAEVLGPDGRPAARASFRIAGRSDRGPSRGITVRGLMTREGVECPALRSDDGELYTLTGRTRDFGPGDVVTVTGRIADRSICQQGTTIEVERMEAGR
jgi:LysM repeat protein